MLSKLAGSIAKSRGWSTKVAEGMVFGRWSGVVGEDIASHATPVKLENGVLSIAAESTAWATQLRMLQSQILAKINAAVGQGVVTSVKISGPAAPSWRKGNAISRAADLAIPTAEPFLYVVPSVTLIRIAGPVSCWRREQRFHVEQRGDPGRRPTPLVESCHR